MPKDPSRLPGFWKAEFPRWHIKIGWVNVDILRADALGRPAFAAERQIQFSGKGGVDSRGIDPAIDKARVRGATPNPSLDDDLIPNEIKRHFALRTVNRPPGLTIGRRHASCHQLKRHEQADYDPRSH
jgi:hypothetical protein